MTISASISDMIGQIQTSNYGKDALRGRRIESVPERFIKKVIGNLDLGETTYLKDRFLEFLKNYSEFF